MDNFLYDPEVGPLENIFGLGEMALMFIPGWRLATLAMAILGLGPAAMGRLLDKILGLETMDDLLNSDPELLASKVKSNEGIFTDILEKAGSHNERLVKEAGIGSLLRFLKFKNLTRFFMGLISFAGTLTVGAVGAKTVKEIRETQKDDRKDDLFSDDIFSTKEKAVDVRRKLEKAVDRIFEQYSY